MDLTNYDNLDIKISVKKMEITEYSHEETMDRLLELVNMLGGSTGLERVAAMLAQYPQPHSMRVLQTAIHRAYYYAWTEKK